MDVGWRTGEEEIRQRGRLATSAIGEFVDKLVGGFVFRLRQFSSDLQYPSQETKGMVWGERSGGSRPSSQAILCDTLEMKVVPRRTECSEREREREREQLR